ncbi:MAG TPA: hypothetical protein PKI61_02140 [bacterium]|nr:hypothetical protein [bacterium]HPT29952.1 hypothetical protein [bacterium]
METYIAAILFLIIHLGIILSFLLYIKRIRRKFKFCQDIRLVSDSTQDDCWDFLGTLSEAPTSFLIEFKDDIAAQLQANLFGPGTDEEMQAHCLEELGMDLKSCYANTRKDAYWSFIFQALIGAGSYKVGLLYVHLMKIKIEENDELSNAIGILENHFVRLDQCSSEVRYNLRESICQEMDKYISIISPKIEWMTLMRDEKIKFREAFRV